MNFWELSVPDSDPAIVDHGTQRSLSYRELARSVAQVRLQLPNRMKTLGFVFCRNSPASLLGYLAALQSGNTVHLLDANINSRLRDELLQLYRPEWLWLPQESESPQEYRSIGDAYGYQLMTRKEQDSGNSDIHPDLALLISTSGTTGSPKMVRLSYQNLQANAASIAIFLELTSTERPITTLPMQYSYGLSVINSHLLKGATLLMTEENLVSRGFWDFFHEQRATSIAGVPYIYQMLHRLQFAKMELPSLRYLTQSGGRLDETLQRYFVEAARQKNIRFYFMYGQTEATTRISYVPYEKVMEGIGSIGIPIPGGKLEIDPESGELIYTGPNVMMGYATSRGDLGRGDELNGRLQTGDIARQGENGYYYIVGRKKRFVKVLGLRINLDEVERRVEQAIGGECYCTGDDTRLVVVVRDESQLPQVNRILVDIYHLHPSVCKIVALPDIPRLPNGKVDYHALLERVRS
jgi:long-chain acyl-CoA synthetase